MAYNPRLSAFFDESDSRWGKPEDNSQTLIRYWMGDAFDNAVYGLRMTSGEMLAILGPKKQRKTTLLANWILNFARQLQEREEWIAVDTLESGMPPARYADTLVAMLATKIIVSNVFGKDRAEWPQASTIMNHPDIGHQLRLNPDFFLYSNRTPLQAQAIQLAKNITNRFPISLFGPAKEMGESRNLDAVLKRWELLYEGKFPGMEGRKHKLFTLDNIQQLQQFAGNSYYGLEIVVNAVSTFLVTHIGTVGIVLSQPSLTSQRSEDGVLEARGGSRLAEECNYVYQPEYDRATNALVMKITTPYSRLTPPPTVNQDLEPFSGAFLRLSTPVYGET